MSEVLGVSLEVGRQQTGFERECWYNGHERRMIQAARALIVKYQVRTGMLAWQEASVFVLGKCHVWSFSFWCINGCFHGAAGQDTPQKETSSAWSWMMHGTRCKITGELLCTSDQTVFRSAVLAGAVNARQQGGVWGRPNKKNQKNPTTKKTKVSQHLILKRGTV